MASDGRFSPSTHIRFNGREIHALSIIRQPTDTDSFATRQDEESGAGFLKEHAFLTRNTPLTVAPSRTRLGYSRQATYTHATTLHSLGETEARHPSCLPLTNMRYCSEDDVHDPHGTEPPLLAAPDGREDTAPT